MHNNHYDTAYSFKSESDRLILGGPDRLGGLLNPVRQRFCIFIGIRASNISRMCLFADYWWSWNLGGDSFGGLGWFIGVLGGVRGSSGVF